MREPRNNAAAVLLRSLPLVAVLCGTVRAETLWYNGDWDLVAGYVNRIDTWGMSVVPEAYMFDDFNVAHSLGWHVTQIYTNDWNCGEPGEGSQVAWSIRTGMSPGNPGTILFRGTSSATVTPTGRCRSAPFDPTLEYTFRVSGLDIALAPGTYWLNVTPYSNGDVLISPTDGANAVGTPAGNNGNSLWYWPEFPDRYYISVSEYEGWLADFSMGVEGEVLPEPATLSLLAMGGLAVLLRRRR